MTACEGVPVRKHSILPSVNHRSTVIASVFILPSVNHR